VLPHVCSLRGPRAFGAIRQALLAGSERFGMRVCEFSVQGNHLHMIAEAEDGRCLSRGMQGFSVRVARA
jgi:REP element-mobilizing transposase RayT